METEDIVIITTKPRSYNPRSQQDIPISISSENYTQNTTGIEITPDYESDIFSENENPKILEPDTEGGNISPEILTQILNTLSEIKDILNKNLDANLRMVNQKKRSNHRRSLSS